MRTEDQWRSCCTCRPRSRLAMLQSLSESFSLSLSLSLSLFLSVCLCACVCVCPCYQHYIFLTTQVRNGVSISDIVSNTAPLYWAGSTSDLGLAGLAIGNLTMAANVGGRLIAQRAWLSSKGVVATAHYDTYHNIFVQIRGEREKLVELVSFVLMWCLVSLSLPLSLSLFSLSLPLLSLSLSLSLSFFLSFSHFPSLFFLQAKKNSACCPQNKCTTCTCTHRSIQATANRRFYEFTRKSIKFCIQNFLMTKLSGSR